VLELLRRLNDEFHKTIIMVTHDAHAAARAKTVLHLEKGDLVEKRASGGVSAPGAGAAT
jgi:putative ABC transport system ATP-binding protein